MRKVTLWFAVARLGACPDREPRKTPVADRRYSLGAGIRHLDTGLGAVIPAQAGIQYHDESIRSCHRARFPSPVVVPLFWLPS